jgi:hypothetical protein
MEDRGLKMAGGVGKVDPDTCNAKDREERGSEVIVMIDFSIRL